jgi:hypothetical protein
VYRAAVQLRNPGDECKEYCPPESAKLVAREYSASSRPRVKVLAEPSRDGKSSGRMSGVHAFRPRTRPRSSPASARAPIL